MLPAELSAMAKSIGCVLSMDHRSAAVAPAKAGPVRQPGVRQASSVAVATSHFSAGATASPSNVIAKPQVIGIHPRQIKLAVDKRTRPWPV